MKDVFCTTISKWKAGEDWLIDSVFHNVRSGKKSKSMEKTYPVKKADDIRQPFIDYVIFKIKVLQR